MVRGVNIRYLAQGMIKIPASELPKEFFSWEMDEDDYPVLAQTPAWEAFNAPNSQMLKLAPEKEEAHD